ncbi:MAG: ABC transporter ATP-binding protein [Acidobacteria bacterium]|nr:ABC transporter ATP-binding protein [Acidobacteriota bacterium]
MRSFFRVLSVAKHHAGWIGVALISMILVASSTVFAYNLIRPIYDSVLHGTSSSQVHGTSKIPIPKKGFVGDLDKASRRAQAWLGDLVGKSRATVLVLVFLAIVVKNVFTFVARYSIAQLGLATIRDLRDLICAALLRQSPRFFHEVPSGVLIARVVNDVKVIHEALAERFGDLLQDSLTVVVLLVYIFSLNFRLALVTLVLAPVLLAPVVHFSRRLRKRSRQSQERMGDLTAILDETIKGIRVVQAFGMEQFEFKRFKEATYRHFWANLKARAIQAANAPVMEIIGSLGALALIGYASHQISSGAMTLGDFSAFLLGIYGAYNPIKRLNKFNLALQQAIVASERVYEILDAPIEVQDKPGAKELTDIGDGVVLDHVWFAYEDENWVLKDIDLEIPAGKSVAIVGASGAGKTTIAQLIPRFWDVQKGAVRIGGADIRDVTLKSLREQIGLVTQETVLFNDTVRKNIAFGRDDAPQAAIEAAAKAAYAHNFIMALPQGYDTVIGESGLKLSGGERQRIAIARALFKDPPLLILDEATSQLDTEAERLVQHALDNLIQGRTTLVIAHRLTTVRNADTVAVLRDGEIIERGSHAELLRSGGAFAQMVAAQELMSSGRDA